MKQAEESLTKNIIVVVVLLIAAVVLVYLFFYLDKAKINTLSPKENSVKFNLPSLPKIDAKHPMFESEIYANLRLFSDLPVQVGKLGRDNPFETLSASSTSDFLDDDSDDEIFIPDEDSVDDNGEIIPSRPAEYGNK